MAHALLQSESVLELGGITKVFNQSVSLVLLLMSFQKG